MMIHITYIDDDGQEIEHALPGKNEVCTRCEGYGTHLDPSIGEHAYSQEEFEEAFYEEEDRHAYFQRGGRYDVQCQECHDNKVVQVVDQERCTTTEQKAILKAYLASEEATARYRAEDRATYRMESGGYGD